jgi:hypothetical protein
MSKIDRLIQYYESMPLEINNTRYIDFPVIMIFYNEKDRLVVNLGNIYKGKLACSIMKILPIFKIKVDKFNLIVKRLNILLIKCF